jgi:hypothetical protein
MIAIIIIMISIGLFTFFLFSDTKDFSNSFGKEPSLIIIIDNKVIIDNNEIISASEILDLTKQINRTGSETGYDESDQYKSLDKSAVDQLNSNYIAGEMKKVQGNYYKVIIIKLSAIEKALPDIINIPENLTSRIDDQQPSTTQPEIQRPKLPKTLTKTELISFIRSDDPQTIFIDMMLKDMPSQKTESIKAELMKSPDLTYENVKGMAVMIAMNSIIKQQGFKILFADFQKGDIDIYPETFVFKIAKGIPYGLLQKFVPIENKSMNNTTG